MGLCAALGAAHAGWGQRHSVSSPTIQNILLQHEMGTKVDRLLKLDAQAAADPSALSAEQLAALEAANPCYCARHVESSRPGELLAQDAFFIGHFKGVREVWTRSTCTRSRIPTTYDSSAFGFLHTTQVPGCAVAVLHNDVLPF